MEKVSNLFETTVSLERLFESWFLFRRGKRRRRDIQNFERHLEVNIFKLHRNLVSKAYSHSKYTSFYIHDPKLRHIRKACVKDRLVHQAIYTSLTDICEPKLYYHTYSARVGKGTHAAVKALKAMTCKVSKNNTGSCWGLKCDIKRFYDTVDHTVLISLIAEYIKCPQMLWLIDEIINSFHYQETLGKGIPIGNLTSQIFTNIYLSQLDQFIKHKLKVRYYLRFADDLMLLSDNKKYLEGLLPEIDKFLNNNLCLKLHPDKISLRPLKQGLDYLGYIVLPYHTVLRTKTKKRMFRKLNRRLSEYFEGKIKQEGFYQSLSSYRGIMKHADSHKLQKQVLNEFCLN